MLSYCSFSPAYEVNGAASLQTVTNLSCLSPSVHHDARLRYEDARNKQPHLRKYSRPPRTNETDGRTHFPHKYFSECIQNADRIR